MYVCMHACTYKSKRTCLASSIHFTANAFAAVSGNNNNNNYNYNLLTLSRLLPGQLCLKSLVVSLKLPELLVCPTSLCLCL